MSESKIDLKIDSSIGWPYSVHAGWTKFDHIQRFKVDSIQLRAEFPKVTLLHNFKAYFKYWYAKTSINGPWSTTNGFADGHTCTHTGLKVVPN